MTICGFCGREVKEILQCLRCGGSYCDDCFMPENHNCVATILTRVDGEKRRILLEILVAFILAGVFIYLLFLLTKF